MHTHTDLLPKDKITDCMTDLSCFPMVQDMEIHVPIIVHKVFTNQDISQAQMSHFFKGPF